MAEYRRLAPLSQGAQPPTQLSVNEVMNRAAQEPVAEEPPAEPAGNGCDPNYSPCVPISAADLDCGDIGFSVTIIGGDPHGFDGNDNDGLGCESF